MDSPQHRRAVQVGMSQRVTEQVRRPGGRGTGSREATGSGPDLVPSRARGRLVWQRSGVEEGAGGDPCLGGTGPATHGPWSQLVFLSVSWSSGDSDVGDCAFSVQLTPQLPGPPPQPQATGGLLCVCLVSVTTGLCPLWASWSGGLSGFTSCFSEV